MELLTSNALFAYTNAYMNAVGTSFHCACLVSIAEAECEAQVAMTSHVVLSCPAT